jgi:hypothetical protein
MNTTDELIECLIARGGATQRLPSPGQRLLLWLTVALPYVALVVWAMGLRADLLQDLANPRFIIEQAATLLTAGLAALAAFCAVIPGSARWIRLLPLLPLAIWLGVLGLGCLEDWLQFGSAGLVLQPDWHCAPRIVLVGAVPAIVMIIMLRKGAPLAPRVTVALGTLAAAALSNFALRLFHPPDASLMVLVWHFGGVALLTAIAGWLGPRLHTWRTVSPLAGRDSTV